MITREKAEVFQLPALDSLPVMRFLETLRDPLLQGEAAFEHVKLGAALYQALVQPAEALIRRKKHLIVSPDSTLYYLPFEALVLSAGGVEPSKGVLLTDVSYLVKRFQVTYIASASSMATAARGTADRRDRPQLPLLAFGDPRYHPDTRRGDSAPAAAGVGQEWTVRGITLGDLKFSGEEVRRIAAIWGVPVTSDHINLGEQASVERVRELDLTNYKILHFAVHAVLADELRPGTQPALLLSPSGPGIDDPGLLEFSDVLDLRLRAGLVVLSACSTSLGRLREGEGIVGLTRAFLYAGAASVVVSLWNVEDQSTGLLMEKFHSHLKRGDAKGEALRQAKLEMMKASVQMEAIGRRYSLAAPYFWAPFVLFGDWHQE